MKILDGNIQTSVPDVDADFLQSAADGANIFLTGMAGTGKTTLLRKFLANAPTRVDVTAPTGVAALNVGGTTIHRFCGMMLGPQGDTTNEDYYHWLLEQPYRSIRRGFERIENCETLVIDEISMLPGRTLDFIEWLFRKRRGSADPWGGAQVIVVGDFLQLPPVRKGGENTPYDWAFAHRVWKESGFTPAILTEVRRQNEVDFVRALKAVRSGLFDDVSRGTLRARVKSFPPSNIPRLYTHNAQVDKWNTYMLSELEGDLIVSEGVSWGNQKNVDFIADNLICPRRLEIKVGAIVMTTINDREDQYVNGSLGTVTDIIGPPDRPTTVIIEKHGGGVAEVGKFTWRHGKNESSPDYAEYTQFPLRLAYAMTIHKCQGLTLDHAYIDVRAAREHGQAYVALSRVRSLQGLLLKEWFNGVFVSDQAVNFYRDIGAS